MSDNKELNMSGKVIHWDDEKGFGFIRDKINRNEVFFHISAVEDKRIRPKLGSRVAYNLDSKRTSGNPQIYGKPVTAKRAAGENNTRASLVRVKRWVFYKSRAFQSFIVGLSFLFGVFVLAKIEMLPLIFLYVYLAMSAVTFALYYLDKSSALKEGQRIPEMTLHWCGLLFGWPGANFAQQYLRHKSLKKKFRLIYYVTIALNLAFLIYLLHPRGAWLNQIIQDLVSNVRDALL